MKKVKGRIFALRQERRAYYAEQITEIWRESAKQANDVAKTEAISAELEQKRRAELEEFQEILQILTRANDPAVTFLPDDEFARQQQFVQRLADMSYEDETGARQPIIGEDEIIALSIRKGSLTQEEFRQIQSHAQLSYEFLSKIKWTDEYARIPLVAWGHHEKLNGKGYPRGITAPDIPLETRMMTVADIYEALTAERPYKCPMPCERALSILSEEADKGDLDRDVVDLFINEKIYEVLQDKNHE